MLGETSGSGQAGGDPAPEAVHLSGSFTKTLPPASQPAPHSKPENTVQLKSSCSCFFVSLVRESGSRVQINGSCEALGSHRGPFEREMEGQTRGVTGLITPPLKSIPRTAAAPGAGISVPLHPLQRTALTLSVIYAVLRGNHKPDSMTSASHPPGHSPLLPGSTFQNLFALPCSVPR